MIKNNERERMSKEKIILPLLVVGIGIGAYLYIGNRVENNDSENNNVVFVEEEQINEDGTSLSVDKRKAYKPVARTNNGNIIKREDMPENMKAMDVELEFIRDGISKTLANLDVNKSLMISEELALNKDIEKAEKLIEKIAKATNMDVNEIKSEIVEVEESRLEEKDMPPEFAEEIGKTDEMLLKIEERLENLKEDMK